MILLNFWLKSDIIKTLFRLKMKKNIIERERVYAKWWSSSGPRLRWRPHSIRKSLLGDLRLLRVHWTFSGSFALRMSITCGKTILWFVSLRKLNGLDARGSLSGSRTTRCTLPLSLRRCSMHRFSSSSSRKSKHTWNGDEPYSVCPHFLLKNKAKILDILPKMV